MSAKFSINSATSNCRRPVALVMGVANHRSIAWSSVVAFLNKGYNILMTCQQERMLGSLQILVDQWKKKRQVHSTVDYPNIHCVSCDVSSDSHLDQLFRHHLPFFLQNCNEAHTDSSGGAHTLDALVHSIAYAPPSAMKEGTLLHTTRQDFALTMDISAYSLIAASRLALDFLSCQQNNSGNCEHERFPSITALTYLGSTRAIPNYNAMGPAKAALESIVRGLSIELGPPPHGIRVNAVSSGPLATLAAKGGIRNFSAMRQESEDRSPLRRNVTAEEVGEMVALLASGEGGTCGMTGQTIFVDGGYNIIGGPLPLGI